MNIAYLVLAHHQPLQLARLVDRLSGPNSFFFIHVDKKSVHKDAITRLLSAYNNVQIIATRSVNWMGYSMVNAEIDLMKLAVGSGIAFKYFVLMSGQDYPIKTNEYINNFFSRHSTDFMQYNSVSYMGEDFKRKHRYYHFSDIPYINPRSPQRIPSLVYLYFGTHKHLARLVPQKPFYQGMELFFGSQWFALTCDTVSYILQFITENNGFIKAMKYSQGPDETFFQTIIMNSERRTNVYDYEKYVEWLKARKDDDIFIPGLSSLRYMDWSERAVSKPAVLDSSYFNELAHSEDLFARKFDEQASAGLMDKIDSGLLGRQEV